MQLRSRTYVPSSSRWHPSTDQALPSGTGQSLLKPMIRCLETALGRHDLSQTIVLLSPSSQAPAHFNPAQPTMSVVVGYNGSVHSQAALDLALCIAHQTRLAKSNPVLVHVVYVVDKTRPKTIANADGILWQARCLASEWRGSLNAHLRIGSVATELSQVAKEVKAQVLVLGCHTPNHALVQQLAKQVPCSVIGLPR